MSKTALPKVSYSYATNIVYFNLAVPKALENYTARYYNSLLEMIDTQKGLYGKCSQIYLHQILHRQFKRYDNAQTGGIVLSEMFPLTVPV